MKRLKRNLGAAVVLALCASATVAQSKVQVNTKEAGPVEVRIVETTQDGQTKTRTAVVKPDGTKNAVREEIRVESAKKEPAKGAPKKEARVRAFTMKDGKLEPAPESMLRVVERKPGSGEAIEVEGLEIVLDDVLVKLEDCCDEATKLAEDCCDEAAKLAVECEEACEEAGRKSKTFVVKSMEDALKGVEFDFGELTDEILENLPEQMKDARMFGGFTVLGGEPRFAIDGEARSVFVTTNDVATDDCCCCCKNGCCGKKAEGAAAKKTAPKPSGPEWKTDSQGDFVIKRSLGEPKVVVERELRTPRAVATRRPLGDLRADVLQILEEARKSVVDDAREQAIRALDRAKKALENSRGEEREYRVYEERRAEGGAPQRRATLRGVPSGEYRVKGMMPAEVPTAPNATPPMPPKAVVPAPPSPPKAPKIFKAPKAPKASDAPIAPAPPSAPESAGMGSSSFEAPQALERLRVASLGERGGDAEVRSELDQLRRELEDLRREIHGLRAKSGPAKKGQEDRAGEEPVRVRRLERL